MKVSFNTRDLLAFVGIAFIGLGTAMMHKPTAFIVTGALTYITVMLPLLRK